MKKKIAIFPGSFDPVTLGHYHLVKQALTLFDEIVVAIGENSSKKNYFSLDKRLEFLHLTFADFENVRVTDYTGTTIDFCKKENIFFILRGLRDGKDTENERQLLQINQYLDKKIQTIFLMPNQPELYFVSSTMIRELLKYNKNVQPFLPEKIKHEIF